LVRFSAFSFNFLTINCYVPSGAHNQVRNAFLHKLESIEISSDIDFTIISGDWNCCFRASDKLNGLHSAHSWASALENRLKSHFQVKDAYWHLHANEPSYTWPSISRSQDRLKGSARLDRVYLSCKLLVSLSSVCHFTTNLSDHKMVVCNFSCSQKKNKGAYYKFNTALLDDKSFKARCRNIIEKELTNMPQEGSENYYCSFVKWWNHLLARLKNKSQKVALGQNEERKNELKELYEREKRLIETALKDQMAFNELLSVQRTIARLELKEALHRREYSKAKWLSKGETPSKSFFARSKAQKAATTIPPLSSSPLSFSQSEQEQHKVVTDFYSKLFSKPDENWLEIDQVLNSITPHSFPDSLGQDITQSDLKEALNHCSDRSTPGIDGIPYKVFKVFFDLLSLPLTKLAALWFSDPNGAPSSHSSSVISLIYKKGNKHDIANYRPISLLPCYYKLISLVLTRRLKQVSNSFFSPDQMAFIPKRQIFSSVRLVQYMLDFSDRRISKPTALFFRDTKKAYDSLSREFLFACMEKFGFPTSLISKIKKLCLNTKAKVAVNGKLTNFFDVNCGVPQGSPLSPILFNIAAEAMACYVKSLPNFVGVKSPKEGMPNIRIIQYADDTVFPISSTEDAKAVEKALKVFAKAANQHTNKDKSQLLISSRFSRTVRSGIQNALGVQMVEQTIYLGVPIGSNINYNEHWDKVADKITARIGKWSKLGLSLKGRILAANCDLLSRLWYLAHVLPLSPYSAAKLQTLINNFIDKPSTRISLKFMQASKDKGGLQVTDIATSAALLRFKAMVEFFSASMGRWSEYLYHDLLSKRPELPCPSLVLFSLSTIDNNNCNFGKKVSHITADLLKSWKKFKIGLANIDDLRADQKLSLPLNLDTGGPPPRQNFTCFYSHNLSSMNGAINACRYKDHIDFGDFSSLLSYNRKKDSKRPAENELATCADQVQNFEAGDWLQRMDEQADHVFKVEKKIKSKYHVNVSMYMQNSEGIITPSNHTNFNILKKGLMRIHTSQFDQIVTNKGFVSLSAFSFNPCFISQENDILPFSLFSVKKARSFLRDQAKLPENKPAKDWMPTWSDLDWGRWMKHFEKHKVANKRLEHLLKIKHKRRFTTFQDGHIGATCKLCRTDTEASHSHTFFTCTTVMKIWNKAAAKGFIPPIINQWPQSFFHTQSFAAPVACADLVWAIWKVFLHLKHTPNLSDSFLDINNITATIWHQFLNLPRLKPLPSPFSGSSPPDLILSGFYLAI
jgi:hypothetical protein